jgi:hypothetical protein
VPQGPRRVPGNDGPSPYVSSDQSARAKDGTFTHTDPVQNYDVVSDQTRSSVMIPSRVTACSEISRPASQA